MKKNILFDTSSGSQNMGDYIIVESVERELKEKFNNDFWVKYATHTPVTHFYQNMKENPIYKYCKEADYKFLAGTNILQYQMLRPWANWNINIFNCSSYKDVILVGSGVNPNRTNMDLYTRKLYTKILNKNYIHSTRDEKTKEILEKLGFKAINTGCATTWILTKEHCSNIPKDKKENVIFTLTDYCQDREKDQKLIDILNRNYKKVFFWIQGSEDLNYFNSFKNIENIIKVGPNLNTYKEILEKENVDYVGTRLHAGIYAMQKYVRSIIIIVDNRARDMKKNYNLVTIERENIEELEKMINSTINTNININEENIKKWKAQF